MSSEIVMYHNNFNKVRIPNFKELEQNLLMLILVKIKDTKAGSVKTIEVAELREAFKNDFKSNKEVAEYLISLRDSFFKADFERIVEFEDRTELEFINLFNEFTLVLSEKKSKDLNKFTKLQLSVNPKFEYIVNELISNFTAFELSEFVAINGKYTKTLYRLLKQYRTTGKVRFEWEEFKRIMDIPQDYRQSEVDKWILKPAIKELSKERNLFDQIRVPFKNLAYEKEKTAGRGRGGKVSGISFTFKPENIKMQKLEKESQKIATPEQKYLQILNNLKQNQARFIYQDKFWQFNDFSFDEFKIVAVELTRDEYENLSFGNYMHFNAKNQEQFFKMIDTFRDGIR
ncbi:replication initiation protein [Campylobacter jejuni]|nr:replication initiation protein [Campylobacter jejuni]